MTRDERTADLALHGWVPVARSWVSGGPADVHGLFMPQYMFGFIVMPNGPVAHVKLLNFPDFVYRECAWDDISDEVLEAIEKRLAMT